MRITALLLTAGVLLAACATPTPYQASGSDGGIYGYSEQRIEGDRYRITFSGNSLTDRETVETYLLYRVGKVWYLYSPRHDRELVEIPEDPEADGGE